MNFSEITGKLESGAALDGPEIDAAFAALMDGAVEHDAAKRFLELTVSHMGDPALIAGGANALRERMVKVHAPEGAIDVCGTGGDGAHTLNVSTAVAFVLAGCGVPVAKHGNRAMSSKCGAADVLEALGVTLTGDAATLERCLSEANVAFLFAQNHHPAMRHVAAARKELGSRTIFNLLGPLSNPAGVKRQIVGVFAPEFMRPIAEALRLLGSERAMALHGAGGLDELSFANSGQNRCVLFDGDNIEELTLDQEQIAHAFGVTLMPISALAGGDAQQNASVLKSLLDNHLHKSAYESTVLLNAMQALALADRAQSADEAWEMASESIRSGAARAALDKLVAISAGAP